MKDRTKKITYLALGAVGLALLLGLLVWYYSSQGLIKITKTPEEKEVERLLTIDRSRFVSPYGLSEEDFEKRIQKLEDKKKEILAKPGDAQLWSEFGFYLNNVNDHAGAAAAWEKSLELGPDDVITLVNLGNDYQYFLKDYPKSEYYYLRSLDIKKDFANAYDGLMDLYRYNYKEKTDLFEPLVLRAIENDTENTTYYNYKLTGFFMEAEHYDLAKAKKYFAVVEIADAGAANQLLESYPDLVK